MYILRNGEKNRIKLPFFLFILLFRLIQENFDLFTTYIDELEDLLNAGMTLIDDAVILNVTGPALSSAKGISIYYPDNNIHSSYQLTEFAKDTQWLTFLQTYV